jgi:hypothetical protein
MSTPAPLMPAWTFRLRRVAGSGEDGRRLGARRLAGVGLELVVEGGELVLDVLGPLLGHDLVDLGRLGGDLVLDGGDPVEADVVLVAQLGRELRDLLCQGLDPVVVFGHWGSAPMHPSVVSVGRARGT